MKKVISTLLITLLFLSAISVSGIAEGGRTVHFEQWVQAAPGLTVAVGTEVTLTLLPESFREEDHADMNDFDFYWTMYTEDEVIELGTGVSVKTPPVKAEYNKAEIFVSLRAKPDAGIVNVEYCTQGGHLVLTVIGQNTNVSGLHLDPIDRDSAYADIAAVGSEPKFSRVVMLGKDERPLGTDAPGNAGVDTAWEQSMMSFQWYEADAAGKPITGVIASTTNFWPNSQTVGTRYYLCKGYFGLQEVEGSVFYTVKTVAPPDLQTVLEPDRVTVGESVDLTATLDTSVIDASSADFKTKLNGWIEKALDEDVTFAGTMDFYWERTGDGDGVDNMHANPAVISEVTELDAGNVYRYTGECFYQTSGTSGKVFWATPEAVLTVLDKNGNIIPPAGGSSSPENDMVIANLFANTAHLTYQALGNIVGLTADQTLLITRNGVVIPEDGWGATGDEYLVLDTENVLVKTGSVVIMGDVIGSGTMNIAQLTRTAQALTGSRPLEGLYAEAADFNGNSQVDVSDLVAMAKLLQNAVRP